MMKRNQMVIVRPPSGKKRRKRNRFRVRRENHVFKKRGRGKRNSKYSKIVLIVLAILLLILLSGVLYFNLNVKRKIRLEAGEKFKAETLWSGFVGTSKLAENSPVVDTKKPGKVCVKVKVGFLSFHSTITIVDSIPPTANAVTKRLNFGETCKIEDFILDISDITKVSLSYKDEPDFHKTGSQDVTVELKDMGNNKVLVHSKLFIPNVKNVVQIEMGEPVTDAAAFLIQDGTAEYVTDVKTLKLTKTGDYPLSVRIDGEVYDVILRIRDHVAPKATSVPVNGRTSKALEAAAFVKNIIDETKVTVSYRQEPDFKKEGEQKILLLLTDEGGNTTELESKLVLVKDTQAPSVSAEKVYIEVGNSISYKDHVTVTDDYDTDKEIKLQIDSSGVNLNRIGTYSLKCSATDLAGNSTPFTMTVVVVEKGEIPVDAARVKELADRILDEIITGQMTSYEKAHAIYNWMQANIGYIETSEKRNWLEGAFQGLEYRTGDCFVFAATAKYLLTTAQIKNMDICKSVSKPRAHYWSLVDIGDGWFHYDTTPRRDGTTFFMVTDEYLKEYSDTHGDTHKFDRSQYPAIN